MKMERINADYTKSKHTKRVKDKERGSSQDFYNYGERLGNNCGEYSFDCKLKGNL